MDRPAARILLGMASAAALLVTSGDATADPQSAEATAAEVLFQSARQLLAEGRYAEACPKLEQSLVVDPAPGTKLNLADCWAHIGRAASARALFLEVADAAKVAGLPDKERIARDRAAELEPHLAKLVIQVPEGGAPDLEIERDGARVDRAAWGAPVPVDPGPHRVIATTRGRRAWVEDVEVPAETTRVVVVRLDRDGPAAPIATTKGAPVRAADAESGRGAQRVLGIVVASIGLAGVGVGAILGLRAKAKHDEAQEKHCSTPTKCDRVGVDLTGDAKTAATGATIAFAIGIAGVGAGTVLFVTAPSPAAPKSARLGPTVGAGMGGTW